MDYLARSKIFIFPCYLQSRDFGPNNGIKFVKDISTGKTVLCFPQKQNP
jgi:hypothetical protein